MGLLKTTNETHYHVSKAAAEEQRKAAEAQERAAWNASSGERALAAAQVEVAKEQRKAEIKVAKEHRKEIEAQLKYEKEMRLMDESPEAYRAYLAEESRKNEHKRKLINLGIKIFIGWLILDVILVIAGVL